MSYLLFVNVQFLQTSHGQLCVLRNLFLRKKCKVFAILVQDFRYLRNENEVTKKYFLSADELIEYLTNSKLEVFDIFAPKKFSKNSETKKQSVQLWTNWSSIYYEQNAGGELIISDCFLLLKT